MTYVKLVHVNPKLNEKTMWYRRVDQMMDSDWYFATIWGPNGMISSKIHAVPRNEYTPMQITDPQKKEGDHGQRGTTSRTTGESREPSAEEPGSADDFI